MEYLPEADSNGFYINESEQNIHVWCSIVRLSSYDSKNSSTNPLSDSFPVNLVSVSHTLGPTKL